MKDELCKTTEINIEMINRRMVFVTTGRSKVEKLIKLIFLLFHSVLYSRTTEAFFPSEKDLSFLIKSTNVKVPKHYI